LPVCAKEDHRLSGWVYLSVTKMECSQATTQHQIFQERPEQSTTVCGVKRYCFTTDHHNGINSGLTDARAEFLARRLFCILVLSYFKTVLKQTLNVKIKSMKVIRA